MLTIKCSELLYNPQGWFKRAWLSGLTFRRRICCFNTLTSFVVSSLTTACTRKGKTEPHQQMLKAFMFQVSNMS